MNNTLSKFLFFTVGAAIGSAVTWKVLKTKYEQLTREEIESVKEAFSRRQSDEVVADESEVDDEEPDRTEEYKDIVEKNNYSSYAESRVEEKEDKEEEECDMNEPYVIPPDEFDENGYETLSLYYYEDGVVATTRDEVIDNVDELIGEDSLTHFGEYEDDSVFVRNDAMRTDFEILRTGEKFSEVD